MRRAIRLHSTVNPRLHIIRRWDRQVASVVVIREFLTQTLPVRLRPPKPPQVRQRGGTRITILCAVMVLLSGWFESPFALLLILLVPRLTLALYGYGLELRAASNTKRLVLLSFVAAATAVVLVAWWSGVDGIPLGLVAAAGGYIAISGSAISGSGESNPRPARRGRDDILKVIVEPVRAADEAPETSAVKVWPRFPIVTSDDATIWAIDPARRVLRVMAPANAGIDELVEWDEPIRAVTLKRVDLSWWCPSTGNSLRAARRDRDLEVVCGRDEAAKWRYVFEFAGRDMAERWREVFESWMIKDRERLSA